MSEAGLGLVGGNDGGPDQAGPGPVFSNVSVPWPIGHGRPRSLSAGGARVGMHRPRGRVAVSGILDSTLNTENFMLQLQ
jgi:hypothetical protein